MLIDQDHPISRHIMVVDNKGNFMSRIIMFDTETKQCLKWVSYKTHNKETNRLVKNKKGNLAIKEFVANNYHLEHRRGC